MVRKEVRVGGGGIGGEGEGGVGGEGGGGVGGKEEGGRGGRGRGRGLGRVGGTGGGAGQVFLNSKLCSSRTKRKAKDYIRRQ